MSKIVLSVICLHDILRDKFFVPLPQQHGISEFMTNIYMTVLFIPRYLDVITGQY